MRLESVWAFLKRYGLVILGTIGTLGLTASLFWTNAWLFDEYNSALEISKSSNLNDVPSRLGIISANIFEFSSPVPWVGISIILAIVGTIDGYMNRYMVGEIKAVRSELRTAKQQHGTSKRNYYDTLTSALKYRLASSLNGFDKTCRVTIYRRQGTSDQFLKRIFRYSENYTFLHEGRISVPIEQGIVGAAWRNHGFDEFKSDNDVESDEFNNELSTHLASEGAGLPTSTLSMPTKHYIAQAINDHENSHRVAIVVYESTKCGVLEAGSIKKLLKDEALDVSRFVKHLGALDGEFNPDPGEDENGANS